MTKKHFIAAANLVSSIRKGEWTNEPPAFANHNCYVPAWTEQDKDDIYTRAIQTAEAFIILFRSFNPRFDDKSFLKACGFTNVE